MSQNIKGIIEYFAQQERSLLEQLTSSSQMHKDPMAPVVRELFSEGAKAIAADIFGSTTAGKHAKRFTKAYLKQDEIQKREMQVKNVEAYHLNVVNSAKSFLQSVSVKKARLTTPNSSDLVEKLEDAQIYERLETRIRHTIMALRAIAKKPLITNSELSQLTAKPISRPIPRVTLKFPRLATLLSEITNLEPELRQFVRRSLESEYGSAWLSKMEERFRSQAPRWRTIASQRGSKDILDGMQFGDFINLAFQFPAIRKRLGTSHDVELALSVVQNERKSLVHPIEKAQADINEDKFNAVSLAIKTLRQNLNLS